MYIAVVTIKAAVSQIFTELWLKILFNQKFEFL